METKRGVNRRDFLWTIGSLSSMALLGGGAAFALNSQLTQPARNARLSAAWMPKGDTSYTLFKRVIEGATDFSWLNKGDRVLVKLALNSGNPYPATSDPWALDCLLRVLKEHGATKVYVGDQSGVRNVYWTPMGQVRGTSRAFAVSSGLMPVIERNGATAVFFEERGYPAYFEGVPAGEHHWKQPMQITSLVKEVDHIIYLPRVSSHGLADISSGMKIGVGFLREDSRKLFHQGGENFYAMYSEISEVPEIKSRLRLTVSSGRSVMTLIGPDAGHIVEPESAPIFASESLLANELFAYAFLQFTRETMTPKDVSDPALGGNLWDVQKNRTVRNRNFMKLVWNLPESEMPELPVFQAGDIYRHPAILNYIRLNRHQDVRFSVLELNENSDAKARLYMQGQLKV